MADAQDINKIVVKTLQCVVKLSSFALPNDPVFGFVSSLAKLGLKYLDKGENPLDEVFQEMHTKLDTISENNKKIVDDMKIADVDQKYEPYEQRIKHQYEAYNDMIESVKENPDQAQTHIMKFRKIYESDKSEMSLDAWYRGVMNPDQLFGSDILKVYLDHCKHDRKIMEGRCSHIAHLFYIGLFALMGYTAVTGDDEEEVRKKWTTRMTEIQEKMQEVLSQCKGFDASKKEKCLKKNGKVDK